MVRDIICPVLKFKRQITHHVKWIKEINPIIQLQDWKILRNPWKTTPSCCKRISILKFLYLVKFSSTAGFGISIASLFIHIISLSTDVVFNGIYFRLHTNDISTVDLPWDFIKRYRNRRLRKTEINIQAYGTFASIVLLTYTKFIYMY